MRMWNLPARALCSQHLLGEHVELHMIEGSILKRRSLKGFIERGLIMVPKVWDRHAEIVEEMERRGMNHQSPLRKSRDHFVASTVSLTRPTERQDAETLSRRCKACAHRIQQAALR